MMNSTGIAIFTYNRPSHLRRVLIALEDYKIEKIVVFIDGPKNLTDKICQEEILFMLRSNKKIKSKIYLNKKNIGLANSIMNGLKIMSKNYKSFIVLEDDCVPRKHFFKFMNKCLKVYELNNSVGAICGYQLPEIHQALSKTIKAVGLRNFSSWGWATWSKKWKNYLNHELNYETNNFKINSKILKIINKKNVDKKKIWTLKYITYSNLNTNFFVFPNKSLIKNIGFDGSGVNSKSTLMFNTKYYPSKKILIKKELKINEKLSLIQENILSKRLHLFY